jgi:hypothetical protein
MDLEARYMVDAYSHLALQWSLPEMVDRVPHPRKLEVGYLTCFGGDGLSTVAMGSLFV